MSEASVMSAPLAEIELTILMPCLNEAETIGICIAKAQQFLARFDGVGEVLISDNGSSDDSVRIAHALGARVVIAPQRGNGIALSTGIAMARGRFVIMGDSDASYDFSQLDGFVRELRGGADLVMGNRFRGGIEPGAMPFLHRYLGNPVLSFLGRFLYGARVGDFQCGLRGFRRDKIIALNLLSEQLEFCPEMVMRAALAGFKIVDIPTVLYRDGRSRPPHLRTWHDGWRHLKLLLTFAPFSLFLYPGAALFMLGTFLALTLFAGLGEAVGFGYGALIFASVFVLMGSQLLWFHALARLYAVQNRLLPSSARFEALRTRLSLEAACKVGVMFWGLALGIGGVMFVMEAGQGDDDAGQLARLLCAVAVLVGLGTQAISNGFLWALLSQKQLVREDGELETEIPPLTIL